jgi:hypothetical protein
MVIEDSANGKCDLAACPRQQRPPVKASTFHYFPGGKEDLLLAVAAREVDRGPKDQEPYLHDLTNWQAWYDWRDTVIRHYEKQGIDCLWVPKTYATRRYS